MKTPFDTMGATLPCRCFPDDPEMCACPDGEVALRHYTGLAAPRAPDAPAIPPMTPEQRNWCLEEIGQGSEYGYDRADYEKQADPALAKAVMGVWTEFCRDKGII